MQTKIRRQIKFGTDGWRGIIGDNFIFRNVRIVTQAICDYVRKELSKSSKKVVVGYDTRFLSAKFARAVCEVLTANGIRVLFSGKAVSTPIVSFTTKNCGCCLGIMITASHNPAEFNGLKIKSSSGGSADVSVTRKVESLLGMNKVLSIPYDKAGKRGLLKISNLEDRYIKFINSYLDMRLLRAAKFKVLQDVMYGSGNGLLDKILRGTAIKTTLMHNEINPSFGGIRPEPTVENLGEILSQMKKRKFDLGLALDGDADRIAAVEPKGRFIHPQQILALLLLHLKEDKKWKGAVVKTIAGTTMIDKLAKKLGVKLYETPVGFKYISTLMEKKDILIGGEEAGGIGFKNYIPERDGILAGLLLMEMMAYRKKGISQIIRDLEKEFGRYYYVRDDLKLSEIGFNKDRILKKIPQRLLNKKIAEVKDFDGIKIVFFDEDWLMLRGSGTEPIVRVYAEAKKLDVAEKLVQKGKQLILNS